MDYEKIMEVEAIPLDEDEIKDHGAVPNVAKELLDNVGEMGLNDVVVAGGMESMCNLPQYLAEARMSLNIWFRYKGYVDVGGIYVRYKDGDLERLQTHRGITFDEVKYYASRLIRAPFENLLWLYNDEWYSLTEQMWEEWDPPNLCDGNVTIIIVGPYENDGSGYPEVTYLHENYGGYDLADHMSGLGLCGGNPTDVGVSVGEERDSDDEMESVQSSIDNEAEDEVVLDDIHSNFQDVDAYPEEWLSGDWEEGLESNERAIHTSSSSNVSDLKIGSTFDDKKSLKKHVKDWCIRNAREIITEKSDKEKIVYKCIYVDKKTCSWRLRALTRERVEKITMFNYGLGEREQGSRFFSKETRALIAFQGILVNNFERGAFWLLLYV